MIRSRSFGSSEGFARTSSGASHCAPGPCSRSIGSRSPPDPLPQSFGVRLKAQTPRRIGKHRTQVWLGEALPPQQLEKIFGMSPSHLCIVIAFNRTVAKIAPTIDDLLGRTAADTQLQASTSDQIRSTGVLRHVVRILIAHVDHGGANFNLPRFCANRCEQWKR